ncbi:MAG: hybrid sensor histidine kinase/response regulator [Candidatus Dormibacteria bacterium]
MTVAAPMIASGGALFASFLEAVPDAIIGVGADGTIHMVNAQAESLFGYDRADLVGQPLELLVPASIRDHSQLRNAYFQAPVARPMGLGMELSARRRDGSEFPTEVSLAWIEIDGRRVLIAAVRDITARKRAEAKFRSLLEAAPDAIVGVSPDGLIALVNTQAEALFGYERNQLIGRPVELLVPGAARNIHSPNPNPGFRDPRTRPDEAWIALAGRRGDGSEFPAEVSLSSMETEEGLMVCAAIRDVTERVEAQHERDRMEAQLERDRLERQLHQSQRLESLGQLAGGVAHDFNNLLAAILNYVSFVDEEINAEIATRPTHDTTRLIAVLDDVSQIGAAAERAARLTHQLLAFGRREIIKPEIIDFNTIVGEVDGLLRTTIGEHVELITRCASDLDHVLADRGQMEQVLLNLAVNARDAMPTGGTLIIDTDNFMVDAAYAALDQRLQAGPHVRLRVADTGTGMDRDTVERAFEPFFSTKAKEKGSGLGLATVYGIVNQAGGMVDLESALGTGTTITILLPSVVSPAAPPDVLRPATRRSHGGETILVVEDEDLVLDVARRILTRHGYRVLAARGGSEALALIGGHRGTIHLLLTDVVMPGLTGRQVAERVTELRPKIRVLYMSGYPESVITSQGVVQRGIHLVSKPFVASDLLDHVRATLDA